MNKKYQKGAITIVFLAIIALVLTLILAATQSRVLLSLSRSKSASDILIATYQAESEANDVMAKLVGGYLDDANIPKTTKTIGDIKIVTEGKDLGDTQIVTVTAFRGLAVGKVQAVRRVLSVEEIDKVEIVLVLDCTSSMDAPDADLGCNGGSCPTRMNAQEEAAVNFVEAVGNLPDSDKFKIGVGVFGTTSAWLQQNGVSVSPDSDLDISEITSAIENGFGNTRAESQCGTVGNSGYVENLTSVGTAYRHAHNYLKTSKEAGTKQVEIVITDGEPNTRVYDSECAPYVACTDFQNAECENAAKNYLRCTVADKETYVPEIGQNGVRDTEVDAYAVTIFANPPTDVVSIFQNYATEGGYFNANRASQLDGILNNILGKILEDRSTITIQRVIPTPQ